MPVNGFRLNEIKRNRCVQHSWLPDPVGYHSTIQTLCFTSKRDGRRMLDASVSSARRFSLKWHTVSYIITITTIAITIMVAMCVCSRLNRWHTCDGIKANCGMRRDALVPCAPSFRRDFRVSPKWICAVSNLRVVQVDYEHVSRWRIRLMSLRGAWRFSRTNISSLRAKHSAICFWPRSVLFFYFYFGFMLLLLLLKAEGCRHYTAPLQP